MSSFSRISAEIARLMRDPNALRSERGGVWRGSRYDPNQPRVPAGHPDGGQWTDYGHAPALPQGVLQKVDITIPSYWPPGVFAKSAPAEIVLNALNPDATVYSRRKVPDVAGALNGTVTKLANGFEVTNGSFAIITRNSTTGRIEAAAFSIPQGVIATVTLSPNGDDIQISFSTGI
jgi:hypothetical protein